MKIELNAYEARVIGCLMEKQLTTPEQYPLSLNALTSACNQKSNREPVMQLDEAEVQQTLDGLMKKRLVVDKTGFGSRVAKYQHRFCNTEFGSLQLSEQAFAVVCVLLLRGPQTPGELRTRTARLCRFADVQEVEAVLEQLMTRDDGPLVARLPREPGRRESRYAQLFCGDVEYAGAEQEVGVADAAGAGAEQRLVDLEALVAQLRAEVAELKSRVEALARGD
jgi:uncharacterized protein YceH (UPF0502 family)